MKCLSAGHTKSASAPESTTMDNCWFDHVQRKKFLTNHVASLAARPEAKDPTGNKTSLNIAVRVDTFSEFALLFTGTGRPDAAVSDADESGGDVETTCAETASGHDLAQCGGFVITPHFFASISRVVRFLAFAPFAAIATGFRI